MAFKVNYSFQKAERDRAKKAKKEAKARERDAARTTTPTTATGTEEVGQASPEDAAEPGRAEDET